MGVPAGLSKAVQAHNSSTAMGSMCCFVSSSAGIKGTGGSISKADVLVSTWIWRGQPMGVSVGLSKTTTAAQHWAVCALILCRSPPHETALCSHTTAEGSDQ